jgi:hypothetical protein
VLVIFVICWAACGILGYLIGAGKGRGEESAVLGFLLGPLGLLMVVLEGDKQRRCQFCREPVAPDATVCPHCQKTIKPAFNVVCINCGNGFNVTPAALGHITRCPRCKKMSPTKKAAAPETDPIPQ